MTMASLTPVEIATARANANIGTKLVGAADGMKIWHLRLAPGETLAAHRHDRPYFWTVLGDGKARSRTGDGRVVDVIYRAGDTQHFPDLSATKAFIHDLTNMGAAELVFVTVEFDRAN